MNVQGHYRENALGTAAQNMPAKNSLTVKCSL